MFGCGSSVEVGLTRKMAHGFMVALDIFATKSRSFHDGILVGPPSNQLLRSERLSAQHLYEMLK